VSENAYFVFFPDFKQYKIYTFFFGNDLSKSRKF